MMGAEVGDDDAGTLANESAGNLLADGDDGDFAVATRIRFPNSATAPWISNNQQAAAVQIGQVTRRDSRAIRRFIAMPATKAGMREQWHGVPDQFVKTLAPAGVKRIYEIVKVEGTMILNETNVNKYRAPHHTL